MLKHSLKIGFLLLILWSLTHCVSTPFDTDCPPRDWFELGRQDGSQGKPLKVFDSHVAQCGDSENPPNKVLYTNGRNSGLIGYCQASSGFEVGRSGERYNSVCPDYLETEFIEAFKKGRKILELQLAKAKVEKEAETLFQQLTGQVLASEQRLVLERQLAKLKAQESKFSQEIQSIEGSVN